VPATDGGSRRHARLEESLVFTIGDFSKITGLTVKTIRFYHEEGILLPSHVDPATGYRYYDRSKIETARVITHLRSLDLSLQEIGAILRIAGDDADLREVMQRQKAALETKIRRYREVVRSLDQFLSQEEQRGQVMGQSPMQIEEKVLGPVRIAGIRIKGRYADCGEAFGRIGKHFGQHICGKPFLLHYDAECRDADADFEACMPIRNGKPVEGISVRELPGARCASLLHRGPYDQLGTSYTKILEYVRGKNLEVALPTREVYHKGPGIIFRGNPKNYLTEIQIPIEAAAVPGGSPVGESPPSGQGAITSW
jgi:DNA-binding transcriptional MerR regulator